MPFKSQIPRARDKMGTDAIVTPAGETNIYAQLNSRTKTIRANQRFIFGPTENRVCLKVYAWGVRNYLNQQTSDDSSATLLMMTAGAHFVNSDTDDITNGIADAYYDYGTNTSGSIISGTLSILMTPNVDYILQNTAESFTATYYSGSTALTGSLIFTVDTSTTSASSNYIFNTTGSNAFEIFNISSDPDTSLNIKASGSSGSRILPFNLKGVF